MIVRKVNMYLSVLLVLTAGVSSIFFEPYRFWEGHNMAYENNDAESAVETTESAVETTESAVETTESAVAESAVADGSDKNEPFTGRIVGRSNAKPGEIPWQASVRTLNRIGDVWKYVHVCGATIISEYWLVSAAHCFIDTPKWKWRVVVGDIHVTKRDKGEQVFDVESIYNHDLYGKEKPFDYDVALIKIKPVFKGRGIVFNKMVTSACILPFPQLPANTSLLISGWGSFKRRETTGFSEQQTFHDVLERAVVSLIDQKECEEKFPGQITDRMLCAGYTDKGVNICLGDSGGPLVLQLNSTSLLYGIQSATEACAQRNIPAIYARASEFVGWIKNTTRLNGDNPQQSYIPCS